MSLVWTNSTCSGLGDRLIDLFLMASLSKLLDKNLYLEWNPVKINYSNVPAMRYDDYKLENLLEYFSFPSFIKFIKLNEIVVGHQDIIFQYYLGGIYSPITFYEKFIKDIFTLEKYLETFNECIKLFQSTTLLRNLIGNNFSLNNILSVHLRRTDKCGNNYQTSHGISNEQLEELDKNTKSIINKLLDNHNLYFCSDDINVKNQYINEYKNNNVIIKNIGDYRQTYLDMYIMINSKIIILSQKHSNFSLFCSLINQTKFIYLYENDIIENAKYSNMKNFIKASSIN